MNPFEEQPTLGGDGENPALALSLVLVGIWTVVVAVCGGYLCALAIHRWGQFGALSLWALGAVAGYVGRKLLAAPRRWAAWLVVVATAAALVIAETWWVHWNLRGGLESWMAAFQLLPKFVQRYEVSVMIGALFTAMGAMSAYRQVGVRYVKVPIA